MGKAYWIWYPGDFEIYHGLLQNFSREERGFAWPAYWYMDDCRKNIKFTRNYELESRTEFKVYSYAQGYLLVNGKKHRFAERIVCEPGTVEIVIFAGMVTGVPAVFIEGEKICSDKGWMADDFVSAPVNVGYNSRYCKKEQDPSKWEYEFEMICPKSCKEVSGGTLYDFERELTAEVLAEFKAEPRRALVCYGESETEALDVELCYYSQVIEAKETILRKRAFRYIFIPESKPGEIMLQAKHSYVDIPVRAAFQCQDEELNKIWNVSCETFRLCSGIFFIDGVKRDRWIWSGDAYQSYMVNQYLMFDEDINKRTMWALRGNDPVRQHMNTIVDYSMYWIISIYNHYWMTGDLEFVRMIYPKVKSMMEFLEGQLDENGFIVGRPGDWIFIDWAELDKDGPLCAEQILLDMCYKTMWTLEQILREEEAGTDAAGKNDMSYRIDKAEIYRQKYTDLKEKIDQYFWCEKKGAYIDSYSSGREYVSRHSNLFAILFEQADTEKTALICENVIYNDSVKQITTPYFKFYELEVLCRLGKQQEVLDRMKSYWGGMLREGAVTIWEEYDPQMQGAEHYAMYGDPYGKSLCHAWGATPIYLLGRYYMGVQATAQGYETFKVCPDTDSFKSFQCTVPVKNGQIRISWDGELLVVCADRDGGILEYAGEMYKLNAGEELRVKKEK